jgi:phosphosulfolactate phosphohydrolase-like enzyme
MNKEGIEIMSDINLHVGVLEMELQNCDEMLGESMKEVDNQKQKYEKFKKKITHYICENIMEKLQLPNDIEFCSRKEISDMLDNVTDNWEEQLDDFIDQFEEEWDDV